ncbi:hypothetical protein CcaCcLH18_11529 [Colletotrichum camelliae]|nr:hypothetical protein CcaCcLH18_11529 [Colletotrichum camelliae]
MADQLRFSEVMEEAAAEGRKRKSYYSFGDNGLTATVSASGSLLRISQHFPGERTGFCVDHPAMPEPYLVKDRLQTLLDWSETPSSEGCIGPDIDSICNGPVNAFMTNDRWPTFHRTLRDGGNLNLQYVVFNGTIYQVFQMSGEPEDDFPPVKVSLDLLIRNLDFIDGNNKFNEAEIDNKDVYSYEFHRYGSVREHKNGDKKVVFYMRSLTAETSLELMKSLYSDSVYEESANKSVKESANKSVKESVNDEPVNDEPVNDEPVNDEPVNNEPVNDEPFSQESVNSDDTSECGRGIPDFSIFIAQGLKSKPSQVNTEGPQFRKLYTVIVAYRLEHVSKDQKHVFPSLERSVSGICNRLLAPHKPHNLVGNQTLNFFLSRNLEHILSVCSIPVPSFRDEENPPIALTCGDADSHRVGIAASFYAFQILLLALEHFTSLHSERSPEDWACECDNESPNTYICVMKRRIEIVCRGHMKWLFERVHRPRGYFGPHHWTDGSEIKGWQRTECFQGRSLADTPFQLIKAGDFHKYCEKGVLDKQCIREIVQSWTDSLDKLDVWRVSAFPRYDSELTRSFYLTDHVLIWQAIKSAEKMGAGPSKDKDFSAYCLKKKILERFTTQNPATKQRMVATVRKPAHTRFLLRSKDTALFRAMEEGFFDKSGADNNSISQNKLDIWHNKTDAWKNTIDSQVYHENNDDTTWDDPQRFALSTIVVHRFVKSMNPRPRQDMLDQAISVLFSSSSANGLFPGKLDKLQEPTLYNSERMRDTYWVNAFEIPYVLWKYCFNLECGPKTDGDHGSGSSQRLRLKDDDLSPSQIIRQVRTLLNQGMGLKRSEQPHSPSMKRSLPFNNIVDAKNIVELQDEWLYNMPTFFVSSTERGAEVNPGEKYHGHTPESFSLADTDSHRSTNSDRATSSGEGKLWIVADFRKSKSLQKRNFEENFSFLPMETEADVKRFVAKGRNPEDAKKRMWIFQSLHPSENVVCLSTVSRTEKEEKKALDSFFSRHESFDSYFWEDIVPELNTWETELHLSFHTCFLDDIDGNWETNSRGKGKNIIFPPLTEGEKPFCITKVVTSFRFEGDFFDRYWTCRVLIADPEGRIGIANNEDEDDGEIEVNGNVSEYDGVEDHAWTFGAAAMKQRKCLELNLLMRSLEHMDVTADEIMTKMIGLLESGKENLRKSFEATQSVEKSSGADEREMLDYKGFLVASKRFQEFQSCMRRFEEQITENLATIDAWLNRERQREAARPRWSFNDESRYRARIIKREASNYGIIQALKIHHSKVLNLIDTTTKDLELMRSYLDIMQSDLDLRRAEDIKRFTYVTVVFLPLGFATGIFSTSGSPAGTTLVNMILTAIATLTATVIALAVYKFADSPRSRREFINRLAAFNSRLLGRAMILRILLVMLITRLKNPFSQQVHDRENESPREELGGVEEDQEREASGNYEDEGSQVQGRRSEEGQSNRGSEEQRNGAANGQGQDVPGEQTGGLAANGTMKADDKWRLGAILRSFKIRGTGNMEERFREDIERRASSDANTVSFVEEASISSSRANSARLRRQRWG